MELSGIEFGEGLESALEGDCLDKAKIGRRIRIGISREHRCFRRMCCLTESFLILLHVKPPVSGADAIRILADQPIGTVYERATERF